MRRYCVLEGLRRISGLENATPNAPTSGVTMEKIKPRPSMNIQVRTGQGILFLMENISPHFTLLVERKPVERNRNGA